MKMVKSAIEKKGNKAVLKAAWRDHMRRPRSLKITVEEAIDYEPTLVCETEDPKHMFTLLSSFAELAWERGWRPRGLSNTIHRVVETYKEPAEESKA